MKEGGVIFIHHDGKVDLRPFFKVGLHLLK